MSDAAAAFLNSLEPEQRAQALREFDDLERMNWFYTPVRRKGLPLKDMTPTQRALAFALLSAGLSRRGIIKAMTIISLEEVLHVLERGKGPVRDPDLYFFTVFGEPSENGTWGYRVEGHHVSQNFTVVNGQVIGTPSFFGANPARILEGPRKGLRALAHEEDMGRDLVRSLDPDQRSAAIVEETAYADILTRNSRQAALHGQPSGLPSGKMSAEQKETLLKLLEEYAGNMPEDVAHLRAGTDPAPQATIFAYARADVELSRDNRTITAFSRLASWWSTTIRKTTPTTSTVSGVISMATSAVTCCGTTTARTITSACRVCVRLGGCSSARFRLWVSGTLEVQLRFFLRRRSATPIRPPNSRSCD